MTLTPAGLSAAKAALLEKYRRGEMAQSAPATPSIPRRPPGDRAPLSFGQQQMWLLAQMAPEHPVYVECVTIHMSGLLDVAVLERSFNEIIRRHEIWRTTFAMVDGEPTQVIHPTMEIALSMVDLTGLPDDRREEEASRLVAEDARLPFDLARGPLLRPWLITLNATTHRLYVILHHIVFDVVSLYNVFLPELAALYAAFSAGKPSPLPEPAIQYADYAYWQRQRLQGETLAQQLPYWRELLSDVPLLQLPTDHPRPAMQSFRGALERFFLPRELVDALKEMSRHDGVSLYMTLVAAFIAQLHRYTGQDDIVIGTPSSNRDRPEIEQTMGFFLNTLALRTNLGGDPPFRELVARVRSAMLNAHAHQGIPFELVVRDLQPQRNFTRNPLFQVMFALEPPRAPLDVPWSATLMDLDISTPKLDLSVDLDDTGEGIRGRFQYNTDLFEKATIVRMVGHFRTLLEGIVADPARRVSDLPLLSDAEREQMLAGCNATRADYPRERCLQELFEAQVAKTPDAIAAVFEGEEIAYRALSQRANQLAHYLQACGVGPDTFVGICMERSLEMVVGLLAVLKAGGAYVPLDPAYPRERLAFMLEDARVRVLLTEQRLARALHADDAEVICVDRDRDIIARYPTTIPHSTATPESLAYAIYTSGSTGKPKGVMIPHRALVNVLCSMGNELGTAELDTFLAATSLSFDIAGLELYLPLLVGARVVIAPHDVAGQARCLAELVASSGATIMQATPTSWRALLESGWQGDPRLHILCGGEALSQTLARRLLGAGRRLTNLYGPTETTIWSTLHEVEHAESPIPLGHPIANTQVYILDRHRRPVPVGVPGELYIGGDGVARGYLNRPALTAERFVPNPFAPEPSARMYATGDLARSLPDGTLEFLGRLDNQVKVRGHRIELGEIETLLERHEGVRQAVVMAREDVPGSQSLAAYILPTGQPAPTVSELRQALAAQLPDYMIPSAFVPLDALPITPNGKVDRHALPAPGPERPDLSSAYMAPTTPTEAALVQIYAEVLNRECPGIHDDFFELGGHSLLGGQLIARVCAAFQIALPLRALFEHPTVAGLAQAVEEMLLKEVEMLSEDEIERLLQGEATMQGEG